MSTIRGKLFNVIYDTAHVGSHADMCTRIEDAILTKFDVTEKKPRYYVKRGQADTEWGVCEAGLRKASFYDNEKDAREYCDFLNSKEVA